MSAEEQEKEWVYDEASRARTAAALAEIDAAQAGYPRCVVCGQRCRRLDKAGTCSKSSERSEPHRLHRAEVRTGVRA